MEPLSRPIKLDENLKQVMRSHQIEAADFILDRLVGNCLTSKDSLFPMTGAVLADEMGTGKTLVALSVVWSICKQSKCKGVVVCPPMLINNWQNEVNKWLPSSLGKNLLTVSGSGTSAKDNDRVVNLFVTSHAVVFPLLIIGYEMFRTYSEALNTLSSLEVLVCDEGHRLKNVLGTKTSSALLKCCATRRLVLTGTPIQNNLEELYAVIQFVVPGYLGTLKEFQANFQDPILRGKEQDASDKHRRQGVKLEAELRCLLANVLLRRTKEMVLTTLLPPRRESVVFVCLSDQQKSEYNRLAAVALRTNDEGEQLNDDSEVLSVVDGFTAEQKVVFKGILPLLMSLRLVCDKLEHTTSTATAAPLDAAAPEKTSSVTSSSSEVRSAPEAQLSALLSSNKLKALNMLVQSIFSASDTPSKNRVVIVSNFTTVLEEVQTLCRLRRWRALKIDGTVTAERRSKMIQHFNSPSGVFDVMLLSAKAGGVGINLIGGNRLILMEPDWNPATDQQAMGRVWREGQTKPVFIYRLISKGTIEESILRRQLDKSSLSSVIQEGSFDDTNNSSSGSSSGCEEGSDYDPPESRPEALWGPHMTLAGLHSLLWPQSNGGGENLSEGSSSGGQSDSVLIDCLNNDNDSVIVDVVQV